MIRVFRAHRDANYRVAYGESQGIDLALIEDVEIPPLSIAVARTGLHFALPEGTFGFIKERSSIAIKKGVMTLAGIVDNSYRGEVKVVLFNTTSKPVSIAKGEFVAQLLVVRVVEPYGSILEVGSLDELGSTRRASRGFGSSDESNPA